MKVVFYEEENVLYPPEYEVEISTRISNVALCPPESEAEKHLRRIMLKQDTIISTDFSARFGERENIGFLVNGIRITVIETLLSAKIKIIVEIFRHLGEFFSRELKRVKNLCFVFGVLDEMNYTASHKNGGFLGDIIFTHPSLRAIMFCRRNEFRIASGKRNLSLYNIDKDISQAKNLFLECGKYHHLERKKLNEIKTLFSEENEYVTFVLKLL